MGGPRGKHIKLLLLLAGMLIFSSLIAMPRAQVVDRSGSTSTAQCIGIGGADFLGGLLGKIVSFISNFDITKIGQSISNFISSISVQDALNAIVNGLQDLVNNIPNYLAQLEGVVSNAVLTAINNIIASLPGALIDLASKVLTSITDIGNELGSLMSQLAQATVVMTQSAASALSTLANQLSTVISSIQIDLPSIDLSSIFGTSNAISEQSLAIATNANALVANAIACANKLGSAEARTLATSAAAVEDNAMWGYTYTSDIAYRTVLITQTIAKLSAAVTNVSSLMNQMTLVQVGQQSGTLCLNIGLANGNIQTISRLLGLLNTNMAYIKNDIAAVDGPSGKIMAVETSIAALPVQTATVYTQCSGYNVRYLEQQLVKVYNSYGGLPYASYNNQLSAAYVAVNNEATQTSKDINSLIKYTDFTAVEANVNLLGSEQLSPSYVASAQSTVEAAMGPANDVINSINSNLSTLNSYISIIGSNMVKAQAIVANVVKDINTVNGPLTTIRKTVGGNVGSFTCSGVSFATGGSTACQTYAAMVTQIAGDITEIIGDVNQINASTADIVRSVTMVEGSTVYQTVGSSVSSAMAAQWASIAGDVGAGIADGVQQGVSSISQSTWSSMVSGNKAAEAAVVSAITSNVQNAVENNLLSDQQVAAAATSITDAIHAAVTDQNLWYSVQDQVQSSVQNAIPSAVWGYVQIYAPSAVQSAIEGSIAAGVTDKASVSSAISSAITASLAPGFSVQAGNPYLPPGSTLLTVRSNIDLAIVKSIQAMLSSGDWSAVNGVAAIQASLYSVQNDFRAIDQNMTLIHNALLPDGTLTCSVQAKLGRDIANVTAKLNDLSQAPNRIYDAVNGAVLLVQTVVDNIENDVQTIESAFNDIVASIQDIGNAINNAASGSTAVAPIPKIGGCLGVAVDIRSTNYPGAGNGCVVNIALQTNQPKTTVALESSINQGVWGTVSGAESSIQQSVEGSVVSSIMGSIEGSVLVSINNDISLNLYSGLRAGFTSQAWSSIWSSVTSGVSSGVNSGANAVPSATWSQFASGNPTLQQQAEAAIYASMDQSIAASVQQSLQGGVTQSAITGIYAGISTNVDNAVFSNVQQSLTTSIQTAIQEGVWTGIKSTVDSAISSVLGSSLQGDTASESQVKSALISSINAAIQNSVNAGLQDQVQSSIQTKLQVSMATTVWNNIRGPIYTKVVNTYEGTMTSQVWGNVWNGVQQSLVSSTASVVGSAGTSILTSGTSGVASSISSAAEQQVKNSVQAAITGSVTTSFSQGVAQAIAPSIAPALWSIIKDGISPSVQANFSSSMASSLWASVEEKVVEGIGTALLNSFSPQIGGITKCLLSIGTVSIGGILENGSSQQQQPQQLLAGIGANQSAFNYAVPQNMAGAALQPLPGTDTISSLVNKYGGGLLQGVASLIGTATPPTSVIQQYNNNNAGSLITCPNTPSNTIMDYFVSDPLSNTDRYIAGDRCLAVATTLRTLVSMTVTSSYGTQVMLGDQRTVAQIIFDTVKQVIKNPLKLANPIITVNLVRNSPATITGIHFSVGLPPTSQLRVGPLVIPMPPGVKQGIQIAETVGLGTSAITSLQNLGYSGQAALQGGSQYEIAGSYNTNTLIFGSPTPAVQRGLWAWTAQYVDLSYYETHPEALKNLEAKAVGQKANFVSAAFSTNLVQDAKVIAAGPLALSYQVFLCNYQYTYGFDVKVTSIAPTNIPIPNAISWTPNGKALNVPQDFNNSFAVQYRQPNVIQWANAPIFPYFLYNTSMPASYSNLNGQVSYLNESYDLYSPHNFLAPNTFLDPFPIGAGSAFLAYMNGNLVEFPYNAVSLSSTDYNAFNSISPLQMFIASAYGNGTAAISNYQAATGGHMAINWRDIGLGFSVPTGLPCAYADVLDGTCTPGAVQVGQLLGVQIPNPVFMTEAPNGDVYVLNYTYSSGSFGFNPSTRANLYVLKFTPFGQFNPPNPFPPQIVAGNTKLKFDGITGQKPTDLGQVGAQLTASWSGGYPPYTVTWYTGTQSNCGNPNGQPIVAQVDSNIADYSDTIGVTPGNVPVAPSLFQWQKVDYGISGSQENPNVGYSYCAKVTDGFGTVVWSSANVIVPVFPSMGQLTAYVVGQQPVTDPNIGSGNSVTITLGQPIDVNLQWSGGAPLYDVYGYIYPAPGNTNLVPTVNEPGYGTASQQGVSVPQNCYQFYSGDKSGASKFGIPVSGSWGSTLVANVKIYAHLAQIETTSLSTDLRIQFPVLGGLPGEYYLCFSVIDAAGATSYTPTISPASNLPQPYTQLFLNSQGGGGATLPIPIISSSQGVTVGVDNNNGGWCTSCGARDIVAVLPDPSGSKQVTLKANLNVQNSQLVYNYDWYSSDTSEGCLQAASTGLGVLISTSQSVTVSPSQNTWYCVTVTAPGSSASTPLSSTSVPGEVLVGGSVSSVALSVVPSSSQTLGQALSSTNLNLELDWTGASNARILLYNDASESAQCASGTSVAFTSQPNAQFSIPGEYSDILTITPSGSQEYLCATVEDPTSLMTANSNFVSIPPMVTNVQLSQPPSSALITPPPGNTLVSVGWVGGTSPYTISLFGSTAQIPPQSCDTSSPIYAYEVGSTPPSPVSYVTASGTSTIVAVPIVQGESVCAEVTDYTGFFSTSTYMTLSSGAAAAGLPIQSVHTSGAAGVQDTVATGVQQTNSTNMAASMSFGKPLPFLCIKGGIFGLLKCSGSSPQSAAQEALQQWINEWKQYWNDMLAEQSGDLYLVGDVRLAQQENSWFGIFQNFKSSASFNFLPTAVAADYSGDIFILGSASCGTNTAAGQSPSGLRFGIIYANGVSTSIPLSGVNTNGCRGANIQASSEFAVSPGGQIGYLADPILPGNVMVFNLQSGAFLGNISLSYSTQDYKLDISKYLANGGPYGVQDLAQQYQGAIPTNDVNGNHQPLYITDEDGTLYVLDRWSFDAGGYGPSSMLMLRAFSANGVEVNVDPASTNDVTVLTNNAVFASTRAGVSYPPYGWPLSFNISTPGSAQYTPDQSSADKGMHNTACIAGCDETPTVFIQGQKQGISLYTNTNYLPLGPWIQAHYSCGFLATLGGFLNSVIGQALGQPYYASCQGSAVGTSMSFSSNFENIAYLTANVSMGNVNGQDRSYSELLAFHIGTVNYTNPSLMANASYICYLAPHASTPVGSTFYDDLSKTATPCSIVKPGTQGSDVIQAIQGPLLGAPDAFGYVENQGSPELSLTLPNVASQIEPVVQQSGGGFQCTGSACATANPYSGQPASVAITPQYVPQEYLQSKISGSVLVPYVVSYTEQQTYSPQQEQGTATVIPMLTSADMQGTTASCPNYDFSKLACQGSGCQFTVYGFSLVPVQPSTANDLINGGPTYLVYNNTNFNQYYMPNVSDAGTILPPNLDYRVLTDRLLGEIYVNQSVMPNPAAGITIAGSIELSKLSSMLGSLKPVAYQLPIMIAVNQTHIYDYIPQYYYSVETNPNQLGMNKQSLATPAYMTYTLVPNGYTGYSNANIVTAIIKGGASYIPNTVSKYTGPAALLKVVAPFYFSVAYLTGIASSATLPGYSALVASAAGGATVVDAAYAAFGVPAQTLLCGGSQSALSGMLSSMGLSSLAGLTKTSFCNDQFTYADLSGQGPASLQILDTYKTLTHQYEARLNWSQNNNVLGYNRLIYTFVDVFNNTISAPIDVDLANITAITLSSNTVVNPNNYNDTSVTVTGTAGYYPQGTGGQFIPLPEGSPVYLYYDQNLNYYSSNSMLSPVAASPSEFGNYMKYVQLCAFGNQDGCALANPLNATQLGEVFQGFGYTYATTPTYASLSGTTAGCPSPPSGLLEATSLSSLYECNIYGSYGLPASCPDLLNSATLKQQASSCTTQMLQDAITRQTPSCVLAQDISLCSRYVSSAAQLTSAGNPRLPFCVPDFINGTGTFTTQIGLLPPSGNIAQQAASVAINSGTVQTAKDGTFSYTTNVCGAGVGTITAQYYGAPFPQPGNVVQTVLANSLIPGVISTPTKTYSEYSYTFAPASATTSFTLASYQLSFGGVDAAIIVTIIAAAALAIYAHGRRAKGR